MRSAKIFGVCVLLAGLGITSASCIRPPDVTAEQCQDLCAREGKSMRVYRVGASIPIVHPKPNFHCECGEKRTPSNFESQAGPAS